MFQIAGYLIFLIGKGCTHVLAHQERFRTVLLKIDGRMVDFLAADQFEILRHAGESCHCQHQAVQQ